MGVCVLRERRAHAVGRDVAQRHPRHTIGTAGDQGRDRVEVLAVGLHRVRRWLPGATVGEECGPALEHYLDSRATRFPATAKQRSPARGLAAWSSAAPLFVGADGDRITRGTLQYRVLKAFRRAGIDADRARGALVHGLRHTFATELANADVSVYTLMKLLGHESMVTLQRYVTAAGIETRSAAAQNKLYGAG
jgi:site-specific recombinase XerD